MIGTDLSQYRQHFPVTQQLIYLNHAAVAPLAGPVAEAMARLADDVLHSGSFHSSEWRKTYDGLRAAAARLIHAEPGEIALMKNTSEGIATIAMGLDWRAGDRIIAFEEEFPANQYPWRRLEAKGVRIEWLRASDPLDRIDAAASGARLLALSFVQYLTGFRSNLNAIGEICRRRGAIFLVDAIQGLGAFPVDVRAAHIDALAADGHKWLVGPEGCAILYISRELQDRVAPVEFGWTNVAGYEDYANRDMALRPDAGRYECGTLNTIGCYGLKASIDFLLSVGLERIAPAVQALGDRIAEGVLSRGYELLGKRTPENGAGIVSFRKPGVDSTTLVARLRNNRISLAARAGWVRASPHFYIALEEIDAMLERLP
ncbi:MAG TPA: aminotransferase class V-fold PLP-dependent enzyme [Bryobacteraceae bacterium]|nr:aminotransferase class V-fold PLP-dependent enzyme [Bryobacteraceae bacterium]